MLIVPDSPHTTWRPPWCLLSMLCATTSESPASPGRDFIGQNLVNGGFHEIFDNEKILTSGSKLIPFMPGIFLNIDQRRSLVYITIYIFNCIWSRFLPIPFSFLQPGLTFLYSLFFSTP